MRTTFLAATAVAALVVAADAQSTRSLERHPERDRAMVQYRVGIEHLRAEAWDQAVSAFKSAIEIDQKFEMGYYGLGRAYLGLRQFGDAANALVTCRDLYAAEGGQRFANTQEAQRYRRDQMMELDEILRQYQTGPQSSRTSETVRQLTERRRLLQESISRGNDLAIENTVPAYVSLSLGSAYFRSGKLADAEREYKATVTSDPKSGEAYSNLAVVYLETGRVEDADKAVKAAERTGFKVHPGLKDEIKKKKESR